MRNGPTQKTLEELLAALKSLAVLSSYSLTLYRREAVAGESPPFAVCCAIVVNDLCHEIAQQFFAGELPSFFEKGVPGVCRYGGGFFGFVVPFQVGEQEYCLVADGVRDQSMDLWQLAALSRRGGSALFSLLFQVERTGTSTMEEVEQAAKEVARLVGSVRLPAPALGAPCLPDLCGAPREPRLPAIEWSRQEQNDPRLAAVAQALEQIEAAQSITETIALCCEAISLQFRIPKLAVALREADGAHYLVSGLWGLPNELGSITVEGAEIFLDRGHPGKSVLYDGRMRRVLPALQATLCTCFPLRSEGELFGFFALLDTELRQTDSLLLSIVTTFAASRLSRIVKEVEHSRSAALSGKLMSLANALMAVDDKEELYAAILDIALDLIDASQGSIMLIDKDCENMHIVFTRGMTLNVAQCLSIKVGKGIAGKVAQTGEPLLVNDVEKDLRVAMSNRPRFKSKALVCVPLKLKKKVIGVLNLSDKKNLSPFSEADLQLLSSFANLATLMIERTMVLEESVKFEQLSVTDSLTGLYNRRFLKSRLEEELSRSHRQGLNLSVLFIDLDYFKGYNDHCGHLAGDEALKKTADIIRASVREMDIVARYGGEEFCAVLPGTAKAEAMVVAERIRAQIEGERFPGKIDIPFRRLTASLGVASFPEDGRTFTALVHASDLALYQAKAGGRNRVVAATPSSEKEVPETAEASPPIPAETAPLAKPLDFKAYLDASLCAQADFPARVN